MNVILVSTNNLGIMSVLFFSVFTLSAWHYGMVIISRLKQKSTNMFPVTSTITNYEHRGELLPLLTLLKCVTFCFYCSAEGSHVYISIM